MTTIGSHDVLASYCWHIVIDGYSLAMFQKVDGISVEVQAIEYKAISPTEVLVTRKSPGMKKYGDITLTRGKINDNQFLSWIGDVQLGKIAGARKSGKIQLFDFDLTSTIHSYSFKNAWPTKWAISGLAATSNEVMVETITLCVEELKAE